MSNFTEQSIVGHYGALTPPKILRYFIENSSFKFEHEKHPYTFIVLGRGGPTGKTWLTTGLKKYGFTAFELSESIFDLVECTTCGNHVIKNDIDRTIVIVLNESWELRKVDY